jgi:hypothetical protein
MGMEVDVTVIERAIVMEVPTVVEIANENECPRYQN